MDNVDSMIQRTREQLDRARAWIDRKPGGTAQDGVLLVALEMLTSTVEELAKRNDPVAAEKAEAAGWDEDKDERDMGIDRDTSGED